MTRSASHVKTQTDEQGVYQFLRLAPGDGYNLSFSKAGFKKFALNNVYLGVSTTSAHNAVSGGRCSNRDH